MANSKYFDKVKAYYDAGLLSKERVRAVVGHWITEAEYHEIVGE